MITFWSHEVLTVFYTMRKKACKAVVKSQRANYLAIISAAKKFVLATRWLIGQQQAGNS
jgi:hypothetical protein